MPEDSLSTFDPRTPRPDPRFNVLGGIAAATVAAVAYVLALYADALPPQGSAVTVFGATPVCALFALIVVWSRRRAQRDEGIAWVAAGLAVGFVAMVLQFVSFPAVAPGGGIFATNNQSSGALYMLFHAAFAVGALLGTLHAPARWRRPFVGAGVALSFAFALNLVPLPELVDSAQRFTALLSAAELVEAVVVAACTVTWIVRAGRTPPSLVAWIGIALSFSLYDLVLNVLAARRFDAVWWSSLSMRLATYAVLALGALATTLRRLASWERYTEAELDRRETQLHDSLATTRQLLEQTMENATVLQRELLPHALVSTPGVTVAARYRGAGAYDRIGGDWYDTIPLPSGGLALVSGDVEGHDLGAASLMGQVRAAVRSYALEGHPPSIVMQRVNGFLHSVGSERLVTMAYVELYPEDRLMTTALAGHPAPLLVHADELPHLVDVPIDLPLGVSPEGRWSERTLLLREGISVVLYTDGLLETPQSTGDAFARLRDIAAAASAGPLEELVDALIASVPAPAYDDIAVLAVHLSTVSRLNVGRTLPLEPMSASIARVWLADVLALWIDAGALTDAPPVRDRVEVAQLLLTELVSNAIRHSDYALEVRVDLSESLLRVDVADTSHRMPVLLDAPAAETSGRGLRLVAALATEWGVEPRAKGKSVWFTIDMSVTDDAFHGDELFAAAVERDEN